MGVQGVVEACDVYIDLTQITAHAVAARHPGCIEKGKGGSVKWKPKSTTHAPGTPAYPAYVLTYTTPFQGDPYRDLDCRQISMAYTWAFTKTKIGVLPPNFLS